MAGWLTVEGISMRHLELILSLEAPHLRVAHRRRYLGAAGR
jgi:hypothetical protein